MERRKMLHYIGLGGLTTWQVIPSVNQPPHSTSTSIKHFASIAQLQLDTTLQPGDIVQTLGYHEINDGGAGQYEVIDNKESEKNIADIDLSNTLIARLINVSSVNYALFGAKSDGIEDDGIAILKAHEYANTHHLPIYNPTGEYWIQKIREIPVQTSLHWGQSIFHIDEVYNNRKPVFHVKSYLQPKVIHQTDPIREKIIQQLKPGAQIIPELKEYANHLIHFYDDQDRIGYRAGKSYNSKGRPKEELLYIELEGKVIGDIAWTFKNTTTITAYPAETSFLTIEGGSFFLSGQQPINPTSSYTHNGIMVTRSRTRIRHQWVGMEIGLKDNTMISQSGFYYFNTVFDIKLEDIRLIPREKNRAGEDRDVPHGTYGIGGNRVLEFSMKNVTAEGTAIHWGVMGTNMMKNIHIDQCLINRFDVHFHLWNLTIKDSKIGQKGCTITGGGRLIIENSTFEQNYLVNFRQDYGAKWDGSITIRHCTLKPIYNGEVKLLNFKANDFDYGYPIGLAQSIFVENTTIDYSGQPDCTKHCWLIVNSEFSINQKGSRLFFPNFMHFQNIHIIGRHKGMRIMRTVNPAGYHIDKKGSYDGDQLHSNTTIELCNIDLEAIDPIDYNQEEQHLYLSHPASAAYSYDHHSPHIKITIKNCPHINANLSGIRAELKIEDSNIHQLILHKDSSWQGKFQASHCQFIPYISKSENINLHLDTELGTTLLNCSLHLPLPNPRNFSPDQLGEKLGFIQFNKSLKYNHVNTILSNHFRQYLASHKTTIKKKFLQKLLSHHEI